MLETVIEMKHYCITGPSSNITQNHKIISNDRLHFISPINLALFIGWTWVFIFETKSMIARWKLRNCEGRYTTHFHHNSLLFPHTTPQVTKPKYVQTEASFSIALFLSQKICLIWKIDRIQYQARLFTVRWEKSKNCCE